MDVKALTSEDYQRAAVRLDCDVDAVRAVAEIESRGSGFLADGRPRILYERHVFSRLTNRRFDNSHPHLSSPLPGGYRGGTSEWLRYEAASRLDAEAAMKSCSWGLFQIMGFNHRRCGFPTVRQLVASMAESEGAQLDAFVAFIIAAGLADELRGYDWKGFASAYNGPAYQRNKYDQKLAAAYQKWRAIPDEDARDGSETGATGVRLSESSQGAGDDQQLAGAVVPVSAQSVTVRQVNPAPAQPTGFLATLDRIKAYLIALPAGATAIGSAIWQEIKGADREMIWFSMGGIFLIVLAYIITHQWKANRDAQRAHDLHVRTLTVNTGG